MGSSSPTDASHRTRLRQQEVVIDLSQQALETGDLDQLLHDVMKAVAETLDIDYCRVLELLPGGDEAVLRQGFGWQTGCIGTAIPIDRASQPGYTLRTEGPVIVSDLRTDERFSAPQLLADHNVVSGISVCIGSSADPWGVLEIYTTEEWKCTESDVDFIQHVADVLASAVEQKGAQSELGEIYERISDAFFALDEEWRFTYLNERAHKLINPEGQQLVGKHVWDEFPKAIERQFKPKYEQAMCNQETVSFEEYYPEPLDKWFQVRAYPSETGLSVYFHDITERKERKQELQRTERRFEAIFEDPNILVGLLAPDGTVLDINETAMEYINTNLEDVIGEPFRETPWWDEGDDVQSDVRTWIERAASGEYVEFEADLSRPDGEHYTINGVFRPVTNSDNEVTSIVVSGRDITDQKERERELEKTRRRYQTLIKHFPNGAVALVDKDLQYVTFGGTPEGNTDLTRADIEGSSLRELPSELEDVVTPHYKAALNGETSTFESTIDDRVYQFHFVPVRDNDGNIFAAMGMSQNITEQKEYERELEDAKSQLEAATEAGAIGTWEWNIQNDELVAGPSFARTFGVDPNAAREGVSLDRFIMAIHEDDRDRVTAKIEEAVESCGEYEAEYRVWNADDELRWVVARGRVECDEDGTPVTFPGALTDITERKRTELRLERTTEQRETLFKILPVGVIVADETGRLIEANDTAKEIWGGDVFDAESIAEYERYCAVWADSDEPVEPEEWTMSRVLDGEEVTDPDIFEIETVDGERRIIRAEGMPVRDAGGNVTHGVVTITDITERREYQRKLEESNERLEQFAYAASHDLQEPLRMITSYLQLLENRYGNTFDEDGEEFLEFAVDGADRMREMIDGLLEYSRVETRGDPFEPVNLNTVLEDVLEDLRLQIEESNAEITSEDLPCVEGDTNQLRQVFQNLLSNAIMYSGEESPRIHVDARRRGQKWVLSVEDEGIGIDPDDQDRIFTVFDRLHSHEEYDGTGIGLALCRRIIERHGGNIWVDSDSGEGATFSFTLPVVDEQ